MYEKQAGTDLSTELARERTQDAADRTLMAWIRTSLSLIGFGFTIGEAFHVLQNAELRKLSDPLHSVLIFSISFIALGILGLLGAIIQYGLTLKRLAQHGFMYKAPRIWTMVIAILLLAIGLFALIAIAVRHP
ncbi:YidH family protein [Dictyobacter kobayashii]|uniref:DUF202 domain-containing protein n=1 Tax=Dictyobacter kobayashii TaxID=2014872 RepID=A0A402AAV1_9CHLR|nr:DUF202 domain-containing protein [Dictyobacter kobayashii]GCE16303.1 hypothetical protein KDK_01030 [Dictyobacter kobayashii]